jgi:tRNA modification GTPase
MMDPSYASDDTIAAVATPAGAGAIAVIRVSGPLSVDVVSRATAGRAAMLDERRVSLVAVRAEDGSVIDEALVTVFRGPRSYTGEDSVELACHGGMLVTRRVFERLLACDARAAGPGEFTQRAFLNGRMDLTQAEAVMDLIGARTELALRAARAQLDGRLGKLSEAIREDLISEVAHLEAYIDFPDEDIDPEVGEKMLESLAGIERRIRALAETADQGRMLREGVRTVIFGKPNVGKSSLLNQLAGYDRAIVSETAGTTRDTIDESVNVGGVALVLTDTAGVREVDDAIEREGVERSWRAVEQADLVLEVVDASRPPGGGGRPAPSGQPRVLVLNKLDLGEDPGWSDSDGVRVSCLTGDGIGELVERILDVLRLNEADWGGEAVAVNARHRDCLRRAAKVLGRGRRLMSKGAAPEFVAVELREALGQIGAIAGKVDVEEILDGIFSSFCIGK